MKIAPLVAESIETICLRFEAGDYNPTPLVDLGVLVANADGAVDAAEEQALGELFDRLLGAHFDPEIVRYLVQASMQVAGLAGAPSRVRLIAEILMDCDAVEEGLIIALAVAFASDGLSAPERALIGSVARAADVPPAELDALIAKVKAAVEAA